MSLASRQLILAACPASSGSSPPVVKPRASVAMRRSRTIGLALLGLILWAMSSNSALAQACSDYGGVLDGFAGDIAPSQLQIDQNCTIRNYPASNPLRTNFSFYTQPGQTDERWLIVFDNVVHTGQMACNSVAGHKIWFVNGSSSSIQHDRCICNVSLRGQLR